MAKKKRTSSRSRFLNRAVKAGKAYLRQAEKRLPPDVRKQIDRSIKDGQKTIEGAIKQLRTRLDRTASQVDLEKAMKRLDDLGKQVQHLARSMSSGAASTPGRRTTRRPATRKRATKAATTTKPAPAPKRVAPARRAAPRRRTAAPAAVTPPTMESPSMAIPDPSPREPAG
jgi:polyhydroxyalkanoate synthesis regulator phasin